jgi:hypothetical protein
MKRTETLAAAMGLMLAVSAPLAHADEAALRAEIAELRAQMSEMKVQMKALQEQGKAAPVASPATAQAPTAQTSAVAAPVLTNELAARVDRLEQAANTPPLQFGDTTLFSYGEAAFSRPRNNASDTQADLARAVIGFSHRFDDRTRVAGEFEWEHAVTSADDKGEAEVEQLYVERQFTDRLGGRAGLMLIPLGLLNGSHEPTAYYGVFRNAVETAVIPTTWREGGVALFGNTDFGLNWNIGVTTGFDLSKWDPTGDEGRESPLGSIHQELSLARAIFRSMRQRITRAYPDSPQVAASSPARRDKAPNASRRRTRASRCGKVTRAGRPGRSTSRRSTRAARSAIPKI